MKPGILYYLKSWAGGHTVLCFSYLNLFQRSAVKSSWQKNVFYILGASTCYLLIVHRCVVLSAPYGLLWENGSGGIFTPSWLVFLGAYSLMLVQMLKCYIKGIQFSSLGSLVTLDGFTSCNRNVLTYLEWHILTCFKVSKIRYWIYSKWCKLFITSVTCQIH